MQHTTKELRGSIAVVILTAIVAVGFVIALLGHGGGLPQTGASYEFDAVVPDAVSLAPGAEVRIASRRVGTVKDVGRHGQSAVLHLRLDGDHPPVYRDARVFVRLRTLVGENYVEVYPGTPGSPTLADGGALPRGQALETTQVDQILAVLDTRTRGHARKLLKGMGAGLDGRGTQLSSTVDELSGTITGSSPVVQVLHDQRTQVADIVANLRSVMQAVGDRGTAIRQLAGAGTVTATAVADRDRQLRAALRMFPPALASVRRTTQTLTRVTAKSAPAVTGLADAVRSADPTIRALGPAAASGRTAVIELRRAAPIVERLLPTLRTFAPIAQSAVKPVHGVLRQLNPMLRYLAPYTKDIAAITSGLRSATTYYDATGNSTRVQVNVNELSPTIYNGDALKLLTALYDTGIVNQVRKFGQNPFPAPGTAGTPTKASGDYPRIQPDK
jgi:phospholipid/cholesterol/gamma-HCH transport system substrate-binding protein